MALLRNPPQDYLVPPPFFVKDFVLTTGFFAPPSKPRKSLPHPPLDPPPPNPYGLPPPLK